MDLEKPCYFVIRMADDDSAASVSFGVEHVIYSLGSVEGNESDSRLRNPRKSFRQESIDPVEENNSVAEEICDRSRRSQ